MIDNLNSYFIKQKLKGKTLKKEFTDWSRVSKICIVANDDDSVNDKLWEVLLRAGKEFDVILCSDRKDEGKKRKEIVLYKGNFTITGIPQKEKLEELQKAEYDIVIYNELVKTTKVFNVCNVLRKKCFAGPGSMEYSNKFDFIINSDPSKGKTHFLEQTINYLEKIKTTL